MRCGGSPRSRAYIRNTSRPAVAFRFCENGGIMIHRTGNISYLEYLGIHRSAGQTKHIVQAAVDISSGNVLAVTSLWPKKHLSSGRAGRRTGGSSR